MERGGVRAGFLDLVRSRVVDEEPRHVGRHYRHGRSGDREDRSTATCPAARAGTSSTPAGRSGSKPRVRRLGPELPGRRALPRGAASTSGCSSRASPPACTTGRTRRRASSCSPARAWRSSRARSGCSRHGTSCTARAAPSTCSWARATAPASSWPTAPAAPTTARSTSPSRSRPRHGAGVEADTADPRSPTRPHRPSSPVLRPRAPNCRRSEVERGGRDFGDVSAHERTAQDRPCGRRLPALPHSRFRAVRHCAPVRRRVPHAPRRCPRAAVERDRRPQSDPATPRPGRATPPSGAAPTPEPATSGGRGDHAP